MKADQVKQTLKRLKPWFPLPVQRAGVYAWRQIELPVAALVERRTLVRAYRVTWPAAEVADFVSSQILGPVQHEALVRTAYSVISPGTERAQLLGLPGIYTFWAGVAFFPGYAGSGIVESAGNQARFRPGDRVAGRIRHSSRDVIADDFLFAVPEPISLQEAAFVELGIIVLQGIHKARIQPGESVLVIGQGLIGQLANRLARLAGATPVIASARSRSRQVHSLGPGGADHFVPVNDLPGNAYPQGFDLVIEATGDPQVFMLAASLARPGGRVLGLGTPRGRGPIPLGQGEAPPAIRFIGAHISGVPQRDHSDSRWTYREEGALFLALLAKGLLTVSDLITEQHDPCEAPAVYESLRAGESKQIAVVFDWTAYHAQAGTP